MEAKPICVIYLPENFSMGNPDRMDAPMELMRALNGNFGNASESSKIIYSDYWTEYYWFCFTKYEIAVPEFTVFHPKDFTEIQFNELKDLILADLESMKAKHQ